MPRLCAQERPVPRNQEGGVPSLRKREATARDVPRKNWGTEVKE